eukprot:symbB.v1.2.033618.t1/scaffold4203.1/size69029/5
MTVYLVVAMVWFALELPIHVLAPMFFADPMGAVVGKYLSSMKDKGIVNPVWWTRGGVTKTLGGSAAVLTFTVITFAGPASLPDIEQEEEADALGPVAPDGMPVYAKHVRALTDRDYEATTNLEWTKGLVLWLAIIEGSLCESSVGRHVEEHLRNRSRDGALQSIRDACGIRSPSTVLKRARDLQCFVSWCKADDWWPLDEKKLLEYVTWTEQTGKSKLIGKNLKHALRFFKHVLGAHFDEDDVLGPVFKGRVGRVGATKSAKADEARTSLQLSLTECDKFTDEKLSTLLEHLPRCLQNLRLDLGFTGLKCFPVFPGSNIALQKLVLRFTGSLQSIAGFSTMLQHLQPSLRHLELWFSNLPFLEDLEFGPGNDSLLRLQLVELILYVEGRPLVSKTSKQSLYDAAMTMRSRRCLQAWIHIEDAVVKQGLCVMSSASLKFPFCSACAIQSDQHCGATRGAPKDLSTLVESQGLPFPCSQKGCSTFHENLHGYCRRHRFQRFSQKLSTQFHAVLQ